MYRFAPIHKTLVWGTEDWVISAVPGNESVIAEGPMAGHSINDIWTGEFPLLIKFINTHDDTSVQVHPDDAIAARRHGCRGKAEMWYILEAAEDAHLLSGFRQSLCKEQYEELVKTGGIINAIADYNISAGDMFFIPAGRIHALGKGCRVAEIQQTSCITYRIWDYGRKGLDGKPRELHTELAGEAIDFTVQTDYRTHYTPCPDKPVELVGCEHFTTLLLETGKPYFQKVREEFLTVVCIEGRCTVNGTSLSAGEAGLIIGEDFDLKPDGPVKLLISHN